MWPVLTAFNQTVEKYRVCPWPFGSRFLQTQFPGPSVVPFICFSQFVEFDNIIWCYLITFSWSLNRTRVAEQRRMKERPTIFTLYNVNRIELKKFLCRNGGWNLLSAWGLVKWGFFPTETVQIDIQREFPNSIYSQLSQDCWPVRMKLAQLALTTGVISSNRITALCFRRFEIYWERKMTDINVSEQERKDVIPGVVQGVFLFCGIQLNQ